MNFLKGPEYDSIRLILFFVLVIFTGYFVYGLAGNSVLSQTGNILEATRDTTALGSGVTTETVAELNKEVERLNNVRTSDAWYVFEGRKKRAEKSLVETLEVRSEVIGNLATEGNVADAQSLALTEEVVSLLPEALQIEIETPDTITGELYTEHVDDFENPENSYFRSFVVTKNGKRYDILPTRKIEFARASVTISGKISGTAIIGDPVPIQVKSTIKKPSHSLVEAKIISPLGDVKPLAENEKIKNVAVFLVNYADSGESYFTPEEASGLIFAGTTNNYYKEQSYNNLEFISDTYGWITLPRNSNTMVSCQINLWGGELNVFLLENDVDLSGYDQILIYNDCNGISGGFSSIGSVDISLGGNTYNLAYAQVQFTDEGYASPWINIPWLMLDYTISHEFGHSLGLEHAKGLDCYGQSLVSFDIGCDIVEYGNPFDLMGSNYYSSHFNGLYKNFLGWIPDSEILKITSSGTYTLDTLENMKVGIVEGGKFATIPLGGKKYAEIRSSDPDEDTILYTLEYRQGIGFDSGLDDPDVATNKKGLFVNKINHFVWPGMENESTSLLDMSPTIASWDEDIKTSALIEGNVFTDETNGIQIGPIISRTATGITFTVEIDDSECIRRDPVLEINTEEDYSIISEDIDGYNTFTLLLKNTDSAFCGDITPFSYSIDSDSLPSFSSYAIGPTETIYSGTLSLIYFGLDHGDVLTIPGSYPVTVTATNNDSGLSDEITIMVEIEE